MTVEEAKTKVLAKYPYAKVCDFAQLCCIEKGDGSIEMLSYYHASEMAAWLDAAENI